MKKVLFFSLVLLSLNSILMQTILRDNNLIKNLIRVFVILLLSGAMIIKKRRFNKHIVFITILSIILFIVGKNSDQFTYIFIYCLIQGLFFIDEEEVIKYIFIASIIPFVLVFIFLFLGITSNETIDFRNRMTYGLGVDRVPYFYNIVYGFLSTFLVYYMTKISKNKIMNLKSILICSAVGTYFFIKTDVRGGYIALMTLIVLSLLLPHLCKSKVVRGIILLLPLMSYFWIFIMLYFRNDYKLNKLLSYRPMLIGKFFENINISDILTTKSVKAFDNISIVDNTFMHILIGGGVILTLLIYLIYINAVKRIMKERKYIFLSFIIATYLYFNIESVGVRVENMFIVLWWYLLFSYGIKNVEREEI